MKNPIVTIEMENGNKMKVELYPDIAPNTVKNFVSLVKKGFYDGVIFHRVIPGFMIQGGDPQGVGTGGPGYSIKGEFAANGFVVTDEELEAISQNQDLINDYVDEEGNLVFSRPEAYTTEEVLLLNGKTLETCRISAKEDLNEYSLETFASNMFDQMQEDMDEISLPQTWSTGKYKGYAISAVPKDSTLHYKYYYLHEKSTFVEIITTGFSDHVKVGEIIES